MRRSSAVLICVLILAAGCNLTPAYQRPGVPQPASWPQADTSSVSVSDTWWRDFGSPALDALEEAALAANQDLAAGVQRIAQARAVAASAGAAVWPQMDATLAATQTHGKSSTAANGSRRTAQLSVAYELDLFGRVAATRQAAEQRLSASEFDYQALRLVTVADVAQAAFNFAATGQRLALAQANLDNARAVLALLEAQFAAGRVAALERDQQRAAVATIEASVAALAQTQAGYRNQLAVLSGAASPEFAPPDLAWDGLILPEVLPSVPAALLTQRPDLRRAEAELQAAGADIGVARAALYPGLQVSWDRSWMRDPTATLTTLSGSALAPIFHGGALRSEVMRSQARQAELVAQYRGAVLTAYGEVSDALEAQRQSALRGAALERAVTAARDAYTSARARFDAGAVDYQILLDVQRSQILAEDAAASGRLDCFTAAIALYRALGGGSLP
ncbi:MAG: efflux transporter outer membrane subunit [Porticoccaceae bacterium]